MIPPLKMEKETALKPRRRRGAKAKAKLIGLNTINSDDSGSTKKNETKNNKSDGEIKNSVNESTVSIVISSENQKEKSKKRKATSSCKAPKPGEEGYRTPTQLRNARKRRATKRKKQKVKNEGNGKASHQLEEEGHSTTNPTPGKNSNQIHVIKRKKKTPNQRDLSDPSTQFLNNPTACPIIQKAKHYFANLNQSFKTTVGKQKGWRTVSKLPVRLDSKNNLTIGLFKPNSHEVISLPNCIAHHPSINKTISSLQILCKLLNITPYQEKDGSGYLRYVCINVERSTKRVQLTLVWNSSPFDIHVVKNDESKDSEFNTNENDNGKEQLQLLIKALADQKDKLNIHSLWIHFNAQWKHADNIFDFGTSRTCRQLWKHVFGPKEIVEILNMEKVLSTNDVKLHFTPNVFRQANVDAFTEIIIAIREYLSKYNDQQRSLSTSTPLPNCLELYGGVGTIGLHLNDLFSTLLSSDENPFNVECFTKSLNLLSDKNAKNKIKYLSKDATSVLKDDSIKQQKKKSYEILIVDPPRKGLDEDVLQSLTQTIDEDESCILNDTKVLAYVSCGFDAFQRDCDALLHSKRWALDHVEGHVLFPGSNAVETLAFFKAL